MDPQTLEFVVIAAIFLGVFVLVPIILGLLTHQRKMAELLHRTSDDSEGLRLRLDRLESKLAELSAPRPVGSIDDHGVVSPHELNRR